MKRTLLIILAVLVAAVTAYILLTKKDVVFSNETSTYKAVPLSSPLFVQVSSLKAIPADNAALKELEAIDGIGQLLQRAQETDKSISEGKEIQGSWAKRPFILAFDFVGEDKVQPLIISKIKNNNELKGFERLLGELTGNPNPEPAEKKYSGHKIFSIKDAAGNNLYYCAAGGLILLSPESILVEKGLRQLNSENLTDIRNFNTVNKTVNAGSDLAWYINHERFAELLGRIMNAKTMSEENEFGETVKSNIRSTALETKNYAGWSELDMRFDDDMLSLNGITAANDSLNHFLTVFNGQSPGRSDAGKVLPQNTSFYLSFTFSDKNLFFENLIDYFTLSNKFYEREELLKRIERRFGNDSREIFNKMLKNEVIAAFTDVSEEGESTSLFIVSINSRKESQENFEKLLQNYANDKKTDWNSLVSPASAGDGKTFRVYQFPFPSLPAAWFGNIFSFAKARYAAFYDDYLVFSSSQNAIQKYLADMEQYRTLDNDRTYSGFMRASENKANICAYANTGRIFPLKSRLFNTDVNKKIETDSEVLHKINAWSWQVVCEKDIYFNTMNLGFGQAAQSSTGDLWTCKLGADVIMKPQIVDNYNIPGEKDIIVQDSDDRLHLVSADGKLLWTAPVSGPVLSDIFQVDIYRNGKLQYLFNTKDKLYLIDRNGNSVSGFPVVFDSPASNGVNVFDYDNNRKYRYFVAFENRKVLAFDQNGKKVSGWDFKQTESPVTTPVQHFRVSNRDYIVFKDAGKIYIRDRRGETRVKTPVSFENSDNPLALNLDGSPKIVATDKNGKVWYLYFDGRSAEKGGGGLSEKHFFTVDDLDGNNIPDFVFVDGNKLEVTDENGKSLYSEKFDNDITIPPAIYTFSARQKMVGITDSRGNRIYLFDPNGKQHDGFPMQGSSAFSIGALRPGLLSLIAGNDNGELVCYGLK